MSYGSEIFYFSIISAALLLSVDGGAGPLGTVAAA